MKRYTIYLTFESTNLIYSGKEEKWLGYLCCEYIRIFLSLGKIRLRKIHSKMNFVDLNGKLSYIGLGFLKSKC